MIEDVTLLGASGAVSTGVAAGGGAGAVALDIGGAAGAGIGVGAGAAIGAAVVGGLVLVSIAAVGGYYLHIRDVNEKAYLKRVAEEGERAELYIIHHCLKNEYSDRFKAQDANILKDKEFQLNRNHPLFNSWFQIANMSFLSTSLTEQEKAQIKIYEEDIFRFIKNDTETVQNFHNYMRRYCAANKLAEFSKTLPKHKSNEWFVREKVKNQIISQCFKNPRNEKENKKAFEEIIHKFYATYKAITFLIAANKSYYSYPEVEIDPREIKKYEDNLEKFISERVDPQTRHLLIIQLNNRGLARWM